VFDQGTSQIIGQKEITAYAEPAQARPAILLHSCCGPCSTAVVEQLAQRYRIVLYYCNPNIDDEAEYKKRLEIQRLFVERYNASDKRADPLVLICAPYTPAAFLKLVEGNEKSEEGGARCRLCIKDRLEKTAAYAIMHGYEHFTTTLSVSRHKNYVMILELGTMLALKYGLSFESGNFKKGGGEQRSIELSRAYGLERQNFCGCRFSKFSAGI